MFNNTRFSATVELKFTFAKKVPFRVRWANGSPWANSGFCRLPVFPAMLKVRHILQSDRVLLCATSLSHSLARMLALDLPESQCCENAEKIEEVRFFAAFAFPPGVVKIATA